LFILEATVGALGYLLLALVIGALITGVLLPTSSETVAIRRRLVCIVLVLAGVFLVVHLLSLIVQGVKLSDSNVPSADVLTRYVLRTQSGKIWLFRAAYTIFFLLVTAIFLRRGHKPLYLFLLSLPLVASRSLSSHAAAVRDNTALAITVDAVHLIATALWAGGLPFVLYSLLQESRMSNSYAPWAAEVVKRFSRLALFSVTLLFFTGLYQTLIHVNGLQLLRATPYGNVLMFKLVLFAIMLLFGAANFLSIKRSPFAGPSFPPKVKKALFTRIAAESSLGMLILVLSGFLTVLTPAAHDHARAGDTTVGATTTKPRDTPSHMHHKPNTLPPLRPADGARVKIVTPKQGQVFSGDRIPVQFRLVKGKTGHHVHAYVDNELMGMFESEKGTLTGISPGNHVLTLRVVEADHKSELDASDQVDFSVK
jgi:putative copper resistance protein D